MSLLLEMFTYPFIVRAFVVGVLVSLCAALLGVPLVLKRYSMIGDGLSHVSFGALAPVRALHSVAARAYARRIRQFTTTVWTDHESSSSFSR